MLNETNPPTPGGMDGLDSAHCQPRSSDNPNVSQLPAAMREAKRWLIHQNKVPFYPNGNRRSGQLDCAADWKKLGTLDDALAALATGRFDGLGFALGFDGNGHWQGIDLDKVDDNGLQSLASSLPGYVEFSPSAKGCHAIGYGCDFPGLRLNGVEAYSSGRYFTVTGDFIRGELVDLEPFVTAHLETRRARPDELKPIEPSEASQADADLIERVIADPLRSALYHGNLSGYDGDYSRADLALANVLALMSGDPKQVERVWLGSPLGQRHKTQTRDDYRQRTIGAAFKTKPARLPTIDLSCVTSNGKPLLPPAFPPADTPTLIDAADLAEMAASPRLDMWGGNVPVGQTALAFGGGGSGKSLLYQQLATMTALGRRFLGIQTMPGVALYVTCEDDLAELQRRQHDIGRAEGVSLSEHRQRLALVSLTGIVGNELATFDQQGRMTIMPRFQWLLENAKAIGAKLIVLDNVAHFFAGNENIRNQVAAFLGLLNKLAHDTGAAIILIAHTNKAGEGSGSTAWLNQVRTALKLEIPTDGNGFVTDFDARVLTRIKSNYSRTGERIAFRWHNGAFKLDAELSAEVVDAINVNVKAKNDECLFLSCLAERTRQRRAVSELVSKSFAPTVFARMAESQGIGKVRLEAAMDRLFRAGEIERGFLWRDTAEGKDRHGLRETTANGPANHPPTRSANDRQPLPPTTADTLPIYIDMGGAADGQPPLPKTEGGPSMT